MPCSQLNFSESDLSVQLHFALFNGHALGGYVLKPKEMRLGSRHTSAEESTRDDKHVDDDGGWPTPRKYLRCVTLRIVSLHHLPKV